MASLTYVRPDHTPIEGRCRSCGARYYAYGVDTGLCCKRGCSRPALTVVDDYPTDEAFLADWLNERGAA